MLSVCSPVDHVAVISVNTADHMGLANVVPLDHSCQQTMRWTQDGRYYLVPHLVLFIANKDFTTYPRRRSRQRGKTFVTAHNVSTQS